MEVSVITYKSNYTSSRQLHLITGGVPCQVIKSIRMQPTHSENFITITRAALKQDVAKNEFSNAHSNANLPCYIHFPNYDREIRLHSHSHQPELSKPRRNVRNFQLIRVKISQRCYKRGSISTSVFRIRFLLSPLLSK